MLDHGPSHETSCGFCLALTAHVSRNILSLPSLSCLEPAFYLLHVGRTPQTAVRIRQPPYSHVARAAPRIHEADGCLSQGSGHPALLNQEQSERATSVEAEGSCLEHTNLQRCGARLSPALAALGPHESQLFLWFLLCPAFPPLSPMSGPKLPEKFLVCQNCLQGLGVAPVR